MLSPLSSLPKKTKVRDHFARCLFKSSLVEVRDKEEVMLQDFDTHLHSGRGRGGGRNAYDHGDDDDEEGMGGGGVRCQQQ